VSIDLPVNKLFIMTVNYNDIKTLHNLLDYDVRKFTIAEIQLQKVLSLWIKKASSVKLKNNLQKYSDYVAEHVKAFERFYEEENIPSISISNRVMQAFIDEAEEKMNYCSDLAVRDASLLASIQEINHYKISTYGTACAFANALGMTKTAEIFHKAEINEKQIDDRLSQLAVHEVNLDAKVSIVLPK
jgi:ferritin-like metal-binding protein YciE